MSDSFQDEENPAVVWNGGGRSSEGQTCFRSSLNHAAEIKYDIYTYNLNR